jgi:hypothetical protein
MAIFLRKFLCFIANPPADGKGGAPGRGTPAVCGGSLKLQEEAFALHGRLAPLSMVRNGARFSYSPLLYADGEAVGPQKPLGTRALGIRIDL